VQTCQDFEWLIVDDGSTDNTHELVEQWMHEDKVVIRYVSQENGGKMRAYNKAVSLTETELFVCIDSDDQLASVSVVEDSLAFWDEHRSDESEKPIVGIISLRKPSRLNIDVRAERPWIGHVTDICRRYTGETTIFIKTEILRCYPYPCFEGEKFVTDVYIFEWMDEDYNFLFHPYYSQNCEYHQDGYTMSFRKLLFSNPKGHREYHSLRIRLKKPRLWKSIICYISFSLFVRDHTLFTKADNLPLTILFYPLGCLKFMYDHYMLWKEN
jgi:glycosyltransferase involved in cell wall biosynthesis